MAGKKEKGGGDKKGGRKGRGLTRPEAELWKAVTKDVKRLRGRDYEDGEEADLPLVNPEKIREITVRQVKNPSPQKSVQGREVDLRTAQKFSRGQMEIEARIDLHGMGQREAEAALARFIRRNSEQGHRCVLVITGKGSPGKPGVLKGKVPDWLKDGDTAPLVLKTARAKAQHGGDGALYVLLRRKR